jgi:hypothetical protein
MVEVTHEVLMRQLKDPKAGQSLSEMSQEQLHAYYLTLERRLVGANVAMFEFGGHAPWVVGMPEDEVAIAHEALHHRWSEVIKALDFADAHSLANTSRTRREGIREEARVKLAPQTDGDTEGSATGASEVEQGQARTSAADVVREERLPEAET